MAGESLPDPFAGRRSGPRRRRGRSSPTPAPGAELRGRRVLVGLPGLGWRGDLRADEGSCRAAGPTCRYAGAEWYRAEAEQTEVFAPLVPVERVWVEALGDWPATRVPAGRRGVPAGLPGRAARRNPVPRIDAAALTGRRVVQSRGRRRRRDLRAVTELHTSDRGRHLRTGGRRAGLVPLGLERQAPTTLEVPVHLLWVE